MSDSGSHAWFGHPRGLAILFSAELWERFSYYGMRAILLLFLVGEVTTGGMGLDDATATAIYGLYTAGVYIMSMPGGWVADRLLGAQGAVLWGGGLIATGRELAWCYAPYVNSYKRYMPDSWAPTALVWGRDNRTCGLRTVGHGKGFRVESRVPGADCNPYLAFAATIAAGLWGIEHEIDPGPAYEANAYEATDVPRVPATLVEAIELFEGSEMAREAFGEDVHHHLLNTAKQEWASANKVVTDWELQRGFERI